MNKSLNIDIIFPWEVGLVFVLLGIALIIFGIYQSKKPNYDIDDISITKATTKIFFGSFFCIFGLIQMLSLFK